MLHAPVPVTELFPQQPQGLQRYGTVALVSIAFDASVRSVENLSELLVVTMMLRNRVQGAPLAPQRADVFTSSIAYRIPAIMSIGCAIEVGAGSRFPCLL